MPSRVKQLAGVAARARVGPPQVAPRYSLGCGGPTRPLEGLSMRTVEQEPPGSAELM